MDTSQIVLLAGAALLLVLLAVLAILALLRVFASWLFGTADILVVLQSINSKLDTMNSKSSSDETKTFYGDTDDDLSSLFSGADSDPRSALHILSHIDATLEEMMLEDMGSLDVFRDIDAKLGEIASTDEETLDTLRSIDDKLNQLIKKIDGGDDLQ